MFDESSTSVNQIHQIEEWMETMGFYLSPDDLIRVSSNEKTAAVLSALVNRVRPKGIVRQAKLLLLYNEVKEYHIKKDNSKSDKKLELLKTRIMLKEQLKQKEKVYAQKKEACKQLIKENEQLVQKIQWMNSVLNEENKKVLFLNLNKKALETSLENYCSLRQTVLNVLQVQKRKREDKPYMNLDPQVVEAVSDCQAHIICSKRKIKERLEIIHNGDNECGSNGLDPTSGNWKSEMLEYVTKKLEHFPWIQVFHALLDTLRQQIHSIQSLQNRSCMTSSTVFKRYSESSGNMQAQKLLERIFIKNCSDSNTSEKEPCETLQEQDENNSQMSSPNMLLVKKNVLMEKLRMVEIQLQDVDELIQERIEECKNLKLNTIINLNEMGRTISCIKHFPKKLELIQKEDRRPIPQLDELHSLMHQLCAAGTKEIQLFTEIPLVAIEKLTIANEKVPVYELASSYLKVVSSTSKNPISHPFMMNDATSLLPFDLLLHVWKQLSFFCMLHKVHSSVKPFADKEVNMNLESHSLDENCKKIDLIYRDFLADFSTFESNIDEVEKLLNSWEQHPLNSAIPSDLLIDGLSMEYFVNLSKKVIGKEINQLFC